MEDKDIEIRCVKVLKLSEDCQRPNYFYMGTNDDTLPQWGWCHVDKMRFTKSFEWAMFGVQKLNWHQLGKFCEKLTDGKEIKTIGGFILNNSSLTLFPREIFKSSAKEITLAWVEILESGDVHSS